MIAGIVGATCLIVGTLFMFLASVGTVRLPDVFTRMHAVTKAGTAGVGFIMLAASFLMLFAINLAQAWGRRRLGLEGRS